MNRLTLIKTLNAHLLKEMSWLEVEDVPDDLNSQRRLLRALMNVRPPARLDENFLRLQDELLSAETLERGIVKLEYIDGDGQIKLWRGDITRLEVDAIVNAANEKLLGCFVPLHGCIDNAIHSAAGLQLREACNELMTAQGHDEPTGLAKITPAFNLPSKFILHTVGPIIPYEREPNATEELQLAACYQSCLELAAKNNLRSVAFCCISTGEFHFPNRRAAEIAIATVKKFLSTHALKIVFNVFKELDEEIYRKFL